MFTEKPEKYRLLPKISQLSIFAVRALAVY